MPTLFDSIQAGRLQCPNRIWMAPLTRARATRDHVPTALMAEYYAQRAAAGTDRLLRHRRAQCDRCRFRRRAAACGQRFI